MDRKVCENEYAKIKQAIAKGWNTWNTRSVLSHVLLPQGFAINFGLKDYSEGRYLKEALIGRFGELDEKVFVGPHAYDGSYTDLQIEWYGVKTRIQTATDNGNFYAIIEVIEDAQKHCQSMIVESGMLWNRKGYLSLCEDTLLAELPNEKITVRTIGTPVEDRFVACQTPYLALELRGELAVYTGSKMGMDEIKQIVLEKRTALETQKKNYGEKAELFNALQNCMAWDTVYEPIKDRVVTPVSRIWNVNSGGYALFCWDTYFGACMAAINNKELAYSNAIEITMEKTADGFVPNGAAGRGNSTYDRSQPPVGSMTVLKLYNKYQDKWLLEYLFDSLYEWNTWWTENRMISENLMAWGSNYFDQVLGGSWENSRGNLQGAKFESGLDNSPMYDDATFNSEHQIMNLADVGLTSLFVMDCHELAQIAMIIGRDKERKILEEREEKFAQGLQRLWCEEEGFFLNKHMDADSQETGSFSYRVSPTNFYPLLTNAVSKEQAERMMKEHFYNENEFWGEWIMPSIARNDKAYPDQDYWRGRIWAPMNYLVYLGLLNYDLEQPIKDMQEKSARLIMKEWLEQGHIHENYCADTGNGCGRNNSDKFYHWGALLSLINLEDKSGL